MNIGNVSDTIRVVAIRYRGVEIGEDRLWFLFEDGPTRIRVTVDIDARGLLRLVDVLITSPDVTAAVLREIPLRPIKKLIVDELRLNPAISDQGAVLRQFIRHRGDDKFPAELVARLEEAERSAYRRVASLRQREPHRGPRSRPPEFYRDIALDYLNTLKREPWKVIEKMAEKHGVPRATMSTWVRRAREEGWLTGGQQGRAGGEPGPRLVEYMEGFEEE